MRSILALFACLVPAATAAAQTCRNGSCVNGGAYRVERAYHSVAYAPAVVYPAPQAVYHHAPAHAYQERVKVKVRRRFGRHKGCCR